MDRCLVKLSLKFFNFLPFSSSIWSVVVLAVIVVTLGWHVVLEGILYLCFDMMTRNNSDGLDGNITFINFHIQAVVFFTKKLKHLVWLDENN